MKSGRSASARSNHGSASSSRPSNCSAAPMLLQVSALAAIERVGPLVLGQRLLVALQAVQRDRAHFQHRGVFRLQPVPDRPDRASACSGRPSWFSR